MKLPQFPATRSALPPGSPRRAALVRAGAALFAALVLLVLGLLDRDRPVPLSPRVGDSLGGTPSGVAAPAAPVAPAGANSPLAAGKLGTGAQAPKVEASPGGAGAQALASAAAVPSCPPPTPAPVCPLPASSSATGEGVLLPRGAASPAGPGYLVQLGVFAAPDNALRVYQQAAAAGQPAHIQSRVVLGPFADRDAAERARKRLQAVGAGPGVLIPPERSR